MQNSGSGLGLPDAADKYNVSSELDRAQLGLRSSARESENLCEDGWLLLLLLAGACTSQSSSLMYVVIDDDMDLRPGLAHMQGDPGDSGSA